MCAKRQFVFLLLSVFFLFFILYRCCAHTLPLVSGPQHRHNVYSVEFICQVFPGSLFPDWKCDPDCRGVGKRLNVFFWVFFVPNIVLLALRASQKKCSLKKIALSFSLSPAPPPHTSHYISSVHTQHTQHTTPSVAPPPPLFFFFFSYLDRR